MPASIPASGCAVLFDCDGVLVDSYRATSQAWDIWATVWCPRFRWARDAAQGLREEDLIAGLVSEEDRAGAFSDYLALALAMADDTEPIPGARELVASIPPGAWTIVTSATRGIALKRLHSAGITVPDKIITAEDVRQGKPHPEPYLRGAQLLGVRPGECIVIEDAHSGIRAARAARVRSVIGVGPEAETANPDFAVGDLHALGWGQGRLNILE